MPAKIPTATVAREQYIHYWNNARECFVGMQEAAAAERWHLTALNGVHCVIAAADALLVYSAGLRSRSKNHNDVFTLLTQHIADPDRRRALRHGLSVLNLKSEIEYGARQLTPVQARNLVTHVERFYDWVRTKIETT